MIRYALRCGAGHDFEAWFDSASSFDDQKARGFVTCAVCGGAEVEKALMSPRVAGKAAPDAGTEAEAAPGAPAGAEPAPTLGAGLGPEVSARLAALRDHVEKTSENVGSGFASEARAIHEGEAPARSIYGQASSDEARDLAKDGVPFAPLPFMTRRDS